MGVRVLGVVMTGMGSDGLEGAAWIKAKGGTVITEAEESCVVYGMPRSVVEAGLSDRAVRARAYGGSAAGVRLMAKVACRRRLRACAAIRPRYSRIRRPCRRGSRRRHDGARAVFSREAGRRDARPGDARHVRPRGARETPAARSRRSRDRRVRRRAELIARSRSRRPARAHFSTSRSSASICSQAVTVCWKDR